MHSAVEAKIQVERLTSEAQPALEGFLRAHSTATVFHAPWWHEVIHESYGHTCDYWVAWSERQLVGAFPAVTVRVPFLGAKMVAMPYQYHSGIPLADTRQVERLLVERALAEARAKKVDYFEICHTDAVPLLAELGFASIPSHLSKTMVPLEGLEFKKLREGHRREVYTALESGVTFNEDTTLDGLRAFRRLYLAEGRELGGPRAGWIYFNSLFAHAGASYRLLLARRGGTSIGGLLTPDDGRTVFARCGAYLGKEARGVNLSKGLLWRSMCDAAARGCRDYDLGISWEQDKGLIKFKEGWGGKTRSVHIYVYPIRSKPPAPGRYFEGFGLAKAIWRHLPMPVVDWLGHQVTRWVC